MADQMVRKYEDAIKDLLGSTASVMASAREAKAKVDACDAEIKSTEPTPSAPCGMAMRRKPDRQSH